MTGELTEARRREATRAFIRYFIVAFILASLTAGVVVYAILDSRARHRDSLALRIEYCRELEKLKSQNRDEVAEDKRNFPQTLRLLHLKPTPEIKRAAAQKWAKKLARNAPKKCPYGA